MCVYARANHPVNTDVGKHNAVLYSVIYYISKYLFVYIYIYVYGLCTPSAAIMEVNKGSLENESKGSWLSCMFVGVSEGSIFHYKPQALTQFPV